MNKYHPNTITKLRISAVSMLYTRSRYSTLHCVLEKGVDLHVNERQKIRHYRTRSTDERRRRRIRRKKTKNAKLRVFFYFVRCVRKLELYSDVINSFDWKSAVEHDGGV